MDITMSGYDDFDPQEYLLRLVATAASLQATAKSLENTADKIREENRDMLEAFEQSTTSLSKELSAQMTGLRTELSQQLARQAGTAQTALARFDASNVQIVDQVSARIKPSVDVLLQELAAARKRHSDQDWFLSVRTAIALGLIGIGLIASASMARWLIIEPKIEQHFYGCTGRWDAKIGDCKGRWVPLAKN